MGLWAIITVKAMEKSTHQIQYVPVNEKGPSPQATPGGDDIGFTSLEDIQGNKAKDAYNDDFDNIV